MKTIGIVVAALLGITLLAFFFQGTDFFLYKVFAPRYEGVRRETFEQSKAYQQGMIQELENMQFEYLQATPPQQEGLRSIILHRVADFPDEELPPHLRSFIEQLRREQRDAR